MTTVTTFSVEHRQCLDEKGKPVTTLPTFADDIDTLKQLYRVMKLNRVFDNKAVALQRTGKMGTYASSLGQEAIFTAIGFCMQADDVLLPYYRDYAAMIQRGVSMAEIYSYWGGDERGSCYANNANDFPMSVPIASQCLHAAGVAKAFKIRQQKRVAVVTLGEGGTSEGDFYEAINVAGAWQLPVVFVVNNNQWAISVARKFQTGAQTIAQKAIAAGFEGEQVDGNDVIALVDRLQQAIEKARNGGGPSLIEALTYRLCDHTTADDATRYIPDDELTTARQFEPLIRLQQYMRDINSWDDEQEQALEQDCQQQVQQAVDTYLNQAPQPISSIFDYHYQELPDYLIEQRAMAMEEADNA